MKRKSFLFFFLFLLFFLIACSSSEKKVITIDKAEDLLGEPGSTFKIIENAKICTENGKPIIRKFATTWCPHCKWIKGTYTAVLQEYLAQGLITAHLWNIDIGDDALTATKEVVLPQAEKAVHRQVSPEGSIPTFVFGCKYYRIGNAFENRRDLSTKDALAAEAAEFHVIINKLLEEVKQ